MEEFIRMDALRQAIQVEIRNAVQEIIEDEGKRAAERVEVRVRGMIGEIITQVASYVRFESLGQDLRITVRFPDRDGVL